jgi:hypothetical protein
MVCADCSYNLEADREAEIIATMLVELALKKGSHCLT